MSCDDKLEGRRRVLAIKRFETVSSEFEETKYTHADNALPLASQNPTSFLDLQFAKLACLGNWISERWLKSSIHLVTLLAMSLGSLLSQPLQTELTRRVKSLALTVYGARSPKGSYNLEINFQKILFVLGVFPISPLTRSVFMLMVSFKRSQRNPNTVSEIDNSSFSVFLKNGTGFWTVGVPLAQIHSSFEKDVRR